MLDCNFMFNVKVLTFCDVHRHSVCLSPYIRKFCNQIFHVVVMILPRYSSQIHDPYQEGLDDKYPYLLLTSSPGNKV